MAVAIREINGQPTADIEVASPRGRRPPRLLLSVDVDVSGKITNVWVIASSAKLAAIPPRRPSGDLARG
jgi:hypothetical protein